MKPDAYLMILNGDLRPSWHLLFPAVRMICSIIILLSTKQLYQQHDNVISHMYYSTKTCLISNYVIMKQTGPLLYPISQYRLVVLYFCVCVCVCPCVYTLMSGCCLENCVQLQLPRSTLVTHPAPILWPQSTVSCRCLQQPVKQRCPCHWAPFAKNPPVLPYLSASWWPQPLLSNSDVHFRQIESPVPAKVGQTCRYCICILSMSIQITQFKIFIFKAAT